MKKLLSRLFVLLLAALGLATAAAAGDGPRDPEPPVPGYYLAKMSFEDRVEDENGWTDRWWPGYTMNYDRKYDQSGNLIYEQEVMEESEDRTNTVTTNYRYDTVGNCVEVTAKSIKSYSDTVGEGKYQYTYDGKGNLIREVYTYTETGEGNIEWKEVHEYTYDAKGNLEKMVLIDNDSNEPIETTTYIYNSAGLLAREEACYDYGKPDQMYLTVTTYTYTDAGLLAEQKRERKKAGITQETTTNTYTYNSTGKMLTLDHIYDYGTGVSHITEAYTYNANGTLAKVSETYDYTGIGVSVGSRVYEYDSVGNNTAIKCYSGDVLTRTIQFEYEQTGIQPVAPTVTFTDVQDTPATNWYYRPVLWAVEKGVTNGISDTEFAPNNTCTRAQAVTFLWRAAGRPEPTSANNPFVDVADTADTNWYYKAVLWAVEQGITTGTDETHFSPDGEVSRGQMVTFLWRMHEKPTAEGSTFADVPANEYYYNAVSWAVSQGITNGTDEAANTFEPLTTCSRAHIVTFLYRDLVR